MKCFYHSADLDGHCSGAIIKLKYPDCEMIGINYGHEFPWDRIKKGEVVYMVDFGLQPFEDMTRLNGLCELHWIDHHKTAIDEAKNNLFSASGGQLIKVGSAGCELVWRYFHGDKSIPDAVRLLGRYDVWDHSDEHTLPFQYGMRQIVDTTPNNQELWTGVFEGGKLFSSILDDGVLLLAYEEAQNTKFCQAYSFETELNGMKGVCVNRGFTNSKIFDSVYNSEDHHLMITFCRLKPPAGKWTVSLYSDRDDVDCGAIAKSFGGGGHKGAAGFQCEQLPFNI